MNLGVCHFCRLLCYETIMAECEFCLMLIFYSEFFSIMAGGRETKINKKTSLKQIIKMCLILKRKTEKFYEKIEVNLDMILSFSM